MQAIYAEATRPVRADPSVVKLGSASRTPPVSTTRSYITRLGREHEAQLCALLCGLDNSARINRFGQVAFAIDANWRRRGIGSALLEAATRWAEQASVGTLRMVISRNNWPMRQLANQAGARLDYDLDEIFADIAIASAASLDIAV
jgi:GNAT superfamily N-acetyltransferase